MLLSSCISGGRLALGLLFCEHFRGTSYDRKPPRQQKMLVWRPVMWENDRLEEQHNKELLYYKDIFGYA